MAIFNPDVPEGKDKMPSYLKGYSEPISQPRADTSTGAALSTVAGGLDSLAGIVETTAKDIINKDVRSTVEPIREDFTKELELARAVQKNSVVPAAVNTDAGPTVLDAKGTPTVSVPLAIENGMGKVQAIQEALKNGKINDTYYDVRLNTAVTNLRSKYPGFVDYIDSRVSAITGVNPANAYINNLMQDINASRVVKDKERDATLNSLRKMNDDGAPNADIYLKAFREGFITQDKAEEYINRSNRTLYNIRTQDAMRNNAKGNKDEVKLQRTADFTNEVGATMENNMRTMVTIPGVDTPMGILDAITKMSANPEQYTSQQMRALASQLEAQKTAVVREFTARSNQTRKDSEGNVYSYVSDIGTSARDEIIKSQVIAQYDGIRDALIGGGPQGAGLAYLKANQIIARNTEVANKISLSPIGHSIAVNKYLTENMGPALSGVLAPELIKRMGNLNETLRPLYYQSATEARAQVEFTETGRPVTLLDHYKAADSLEKAGKITKAMKARYTGELVNVVDDLKNKDIPDTIKENVVRYLFSPEGQGILNNIKTDYTDPETNKFVPGKYSVFTRLTSSDVVKEVARLAKSNPEIGQMYKSYLEREAGAQLFYKELQNLNRYTGHDDLHFAYDSDAKRISLIDKNGKPLESFVRPSIPGQWNTNKPSEDRQYLYAINKTVERINSGLAGLGRVEEGLGGDANQFVLNFLQRSQVDLGKNWTGIPQKIVDAIAASRAPKRKIEDTFEDMKGGK